MVIMSGVEHTACRRPKWEEPGLNAFRASLSFTAVRGSMYRSDTLRPKKVACRCSRSERTMPSRSRKSSTLSAASSRPAMVVWCAKNVEFMKSISESRDEAVPVAMVARMCERSTGSLPSLEYMSSAVLRR